MKFLKTKKVPLPEILRTCIGTVLGIGGVAILAKYPTPKKADNEVS